MTSTECSSQKKFYRFFFKKRNSTATKFITLSTNLGRRKGRFLQYADHNIQGSASDEAAGHFKLGRGRLRHVEGEKLVLSLHPITHDFGLLCHTLESKPSIILKLGPMSW